MAIVKTLIGNVKGQPGQDGLFTKHNFTATIGTTWTGTVAPYTQTVSVDGILSSDSPIVDIIPSDDFSIAEAQLEAFGYIYRIAVSDGSITVYSTETTTTEITIRMEVFR